VSERTPKRPVIASSARSAPAPVRKRYDPSDLDAERLRLFRAAGLDSVALLTRALDAVDRFLSSPNADFALRSADQAFKLLGVYANPRDQRTSAGNVTVVLAPFAQPARETKALPAKPRELEHKGGG
jgi:hypothetical protein